MAQYLPTIPRFGPVFTRSAELRGGRGARTIPSHLRFIAFVVRPVIEVPQGTKKFKPMALPKAVLGKQTEGNSEKSFGVSKAGSKR
jgi:hypothetical protein